MFSDNKVTEIFCLADDFCKFFDSQVKKYTLTDQKSKRQIAIYQSVMSISASITTVAPLPVINTFFGLISHNTI